MEASAPGFLTIRQGIRLEGGHRLVTRFVIMKPKPIGSRVSESSTAASLSPILASGQSSWMPPGIDEAVPYVDTTVECPLPHVLSGTGQRMKQFVGDLEKFTATEQVEHSVVDGGGVQHPPVVRSFDYVVMVSRTSNGVFLLDEYRNGSVDPAQFPANIATQGMPAIALLFHPLLAPDFKFYVRGIRPVGRARCLAGSLRAATGSAGPNPLLFCGGEVQFPGSQGPRMDRSRNFSTVEARVAAGATTEGVGSDRGAVLAISYQPVQFRALNQQLWLPRSRNSMLSDRGTATIADTP